MFIYRFLLLTIILSYNLNSYAQKNLQKSEQFFIKKCKNIAQAILNKDLKTLNSYINPSIGIYAFYVKGVSGAYINLDKLVADTLDFHLEEFYDKEEISYKDSAVKFTNKLVNIDCDYLRWNQEGKFIDTSNKVKPISDRIKFWKENHLENLQDLTTSEKIKIKKVEKKIRRIVFTDNHIIFYMSLINNKWYLTVIDHLEGSCDV